LAAKPCQAPDERAELVVPAALLVPGHRAAVVRVVAARHADLVAVVDARCAGQAEHQQVREPDRRLVAAQRGRHARRVVRAEQVELAVDGARRVAPQELAYRRSETGGIELRYAAAAALATLLAAPVTADEAAAGA